MRKPYEKKHGNKVAGRSRDRPLTFEQHFFDVSTKMAKFWKSRWTVTRQSSEVTRPLADCQKTFFFRNFKQIGNFLKKVAEWWRDSRRRSRDRRLTVEQFYFDFSAKIAKCWENSLNGHATVVGGHATVGRLSNHCISKFSGNRKNFEKGRWTVTRQPSEVMRPSADCQTILFRRFSKNVKILKKVVEWSRDSRWTVTRPSTDCQALSVLLLPSWMNTAPVCVQ